MTNSAACALSAMSALPPRYTGKERDTESGNDYMFARYYNSATGRFLSPDWSAKYEPVPYAKLENPQTLNLYGYMQNNPLGGMDPDGHCDWCQKLWNGVTGKGFNTDAQIAAANTPTTITVTATDPQPIAEPNEAVGLGADAAGLLSATPGAVPGAPGLLLGIGAAGVSSANDPSALNLSINGAGTVLGAASYFGEGTAVGAGAATGGFALAVGAVAWDGSKFVSDHVITPVFTPDKLQDDVVSDGNGHSIPNPAMMDGSELEDPPR